MRIGVSANVGGDPERVRYPVVRLVAGYPTSSLAVWVMRNSLVPQRRIQVRYVTVTKMRGYSCTAEVPVVSVSAVVEEFPSRFHLPYPDRDHTSQSLLAERLSTSTLEPIAQQLISLISIMSGNAIICWDATVLKR